MTDTAPPLWIDESPITLCQRERFQRGRTSFFIVLVPMNGRIKSATTRATVVSSRYSAWRVPATLWILPCINMDGASTLWIDESLMNLYEILGFQPEGVATLSFSSR